MGIDFNSDRALRVGFVFRVLVDLTAQLVRAFAVHASRLASPLAGILRKRSKSSTQPGYLAQTLAILRETLWAASSFMRPTCPHSCRLLCSPLTGLPESHCFCAIRLRCP